MAEPIPTRCEECLEPPDRCECALEATMIIAQHGRTRIEGCACGWGMDGSKLGQSHALHVWRELQRAVLPGHDARVRADERARMAEEVALDLLRRRMHIPPSTDPQRKYAVAQRDTLNRAARWVRQHATPPTTEGDHRG